MHLGLHRNNKPKTHHLHRRLNITTLWALIIIPISLLLAAFLFPNSNTNSNNNNNNPPPSAKMSPSQQQSSYNNTCLRITSQPTPDPFVTYARGKFYLTFTAGNRVPLWEAERLEDFWDEGRYKKGPIWTPPPDTPHSAHLWAPELHILQGTWYCYVAAAHPQHGNRSHRMYVLRGPPASQDPHSASSWEFLGPIAGMDQKQWAIDGTVFELDGGLYFAYSGWPIERAPDDYDERTQELFVMGLRDPVTAASKPVRISHPAEQWERSGDAGINEGPQWLESPDGGRTWRGLVYSCAGSWTKEYKMATLRYCGGDPLDPKAWRKGERPLLQNAGRPPWGPGHGNFVRVGEETMAVFHGTEGEGDGHGGRMGWAQRVGWGEEGPWMGEVVGPVTRDAGRFERGGDEGGGGAGGKHGVTGEKLKGLLHSLKNRMDG